MSDTRDDINKRRAQRRKKIRKKRLRAFFEFTLVTAVAVMIVLSLTVLFPVKNVTASGSKLYSAEQISKASGINETCNIFTLPVREAEKNIRSILPYVDTVKIKRSLPDTVKIEVTDAEEYACYYIDGDYYAVSKRGYVLNKYSEQPQDTFLITCNGVECAVGSKVAFEKQSTEQLLDSLKSKLEGYGIAINAIDISEEYNIRLTVEDRFEAVLGEDADIDKKLAHLDSMIKNIAPERRGKIDLSMWTSTKSEGTFTESTTQ